MLLPSQAPHDLLCEEILGEARRQSEQIMTRARDEAQSLLAKAAAEQAAAHDQALHQARAQAERCREAILASVPLEIARRKSSQAEALLQSIHDEASKILQAHETFDCRAAAATLAAEAIKGMAGDVFVVRLPPSDYVAWGDSLVDQIRCIAGRSSLSLTLSSDATIEQTGLIVQDAEGRQVWDNRLLARLDRLWPELRRKIAARIGLLTDNERGAGHE